MLKGPLVRIDWSASADPNKALAFLEPIYSN